MPARESTPAAITRRWPEARRPAIAQIGPWRLLLDGDGRTLAVSRGPAPLPDDALGKTLSRHIALAIAQDVPESLQPIAEPNCRPAAGLPSPPPPAPAPITATPMAVDPFAGRILVGGMTFRRAADTPDPTPTAPLEEALAVLDALAPPPPPR